MLNRSSRLLLPALCLWLAACATHTPPPPPPPVVAAPHHHGHAKPVSASTAQAQAAGPAPTTVNMPAAVPIPPPLPMTNSPLAPPIPAPPSVTQPPRQLADGSHVPALQAMLANAQAQSQAGDLDGAAISLERAQRMAPQSATVYMRLADIRLRQNRPGEAEQLLRKALGFAASTAQAASIWRSLAVAEQRQGNASGAAEAQSRAAALGN